MTDGGRYSVPQRCFLLAGDDLLTPQNWWDLEQKPQLTRGELSLFVSIDICYYWSKMLVCHCVYMHLRIPTFPKTLDFMKTGKLHEVKGVKAKLHR